MSKHKNARTQQPQPSHNSAATGSKVDAPKVHKPSDNATEQHGSALLSEKAANVVSLHAEKGSRKTIFDVRRIEVNDTVAAKVQHLSEARQRLAEAADLSREGESRQGEAREAADKASILLFRDRRDGNISADEVSAALGETFGWKAKQDGTPSKTPLGMGEAIRKRIVRAVQAAEHIGGGESSRFFQGLPAEPIADILNAMESGEKGFWAAYEDFAAVKRDNMVKTDAAFDPKRIAALTESLLSDGAAAVFVNNPALVDVYVALREAINVVGEEAAKLMQEAA